MWPSEARLLRYIKYIKSDLNLRNKDLSDNHDFDITDIADFNYLLSRKYFLSSQKMWQTRLLHYQFMKHIFFQIITILILQIISRDSYKRNF